MLKYSKTTVWGGVGFVFQKGLAQSSGFDAQFLKIILWPCTKLEGAAKLNITSNITVVVIRKLRPIYGVNVSRHLASITLGTCQKCQKLLYAWFVGLWSVDFFPSPFSWLIGTNI